MDETRFDALARAFGSETTRRGALRGLAAGGAALPVTAASLDQASARKKKRRKKKNRAKPLKAGAPCTTNRQCGAKTTGRKCAVAFNASNSDTTCCGATGANCGGVDDNGDVLDPVCCVNFVCSSNDPNNPGVPGKCQPDLVPE